MIIEVSIKDFAKKNKVSLSSVYQKIKRNTIEHTKKNGKIYILEEVEEVLKDSCKSFKEKIKRIKSEKKLLQNIIKDKDSRIEDLKKSLSTYEIIFSTQFKQLENNIIDVEEHQPKKKKKKRNKK